MRSADLKHQYLSTYREKRRRYLLELWGKDSRAGHGTEDCVKIQQARQTAQVFELHHTAQSDLTLINQLKKF